MTRCGYVALLGRPNAGKSTLLNAVLRTKVVAVSAKPQTTRNRITGVSTEGESQILFLDTPGLHSSVGLTRMNKAMNRAAWSVLDDADAVCYLIDVNQGWKDEDANYLSGILAKCVKPLFLLVSKADSVKKEIVAEQVARIQEQWDVLVANRSETDGAINLATQRPLPVSSKRPEEVAALRAALAPYMPESPWLFPEDDLTDMPQQFICGEIIREQIFRQMGQELPYSCGVRVDSFSVEQNFTRICATIVVQRQSHKAMVIGKGGSRLKSIGTEARKNLELLLQRKVHLELFVKTEEHWTDDVQFIQEFAGLKDS